MASDLGSTWWGGVQAAAKGDVKGVAAAGTKNGLNLLALRGSFKAGGKVAPKPVKPAITNERPVVFNSPKGGATPAQIQQIRDYVNICNDALCAGALSPTGRVSTRGQLRVDANRAAAAEKKANPGLYPSGVHPGHGPDTTWSGNPQPYAWIPLDASINTSLGSQALRYSIGYKPTGFWYMDDYVAQFGQAP